MISLQFSYVIVTYNNADTIEDCLNSIATHTAGSHEVIVVDNSPDARTLDVVERHRLTHPDKSMHVIKPDSNIGFGRGCNLGAKRATGQYLFILNPDTQLLNDAASSLARCLSERLGVIAAGPAIFDEYGVVTKTCRQLPNLFRIFLDATGIDQWCGLYKMTRFAHDRPAQVKQIIGAAMLMRRHDYDRVGGMDPRFFIYFEEVDLCKRLQKSGDQIWFWPEARVQHLGGGSCEVGPVRAAMIFTLRESRTKYFRKHGGVLAAFGVGCVNRLEGIAKAAIFGVMSLLSNKKSYKEKAHGFIAVAMDARPVDSTKTLFRILAFTVKPRESADSRYRMLQYFNVASKEGVSIEHHSLMGKRYFQWQTRNTQTVPRLILLPFMLIHRLWQVIWLSWQFDAVWILREMAPMGPPVLERLAVGLSKRVVLDVDDALHITDKESSRPLLRLLRDHGKFARMASSYTNVVCGNTYLGEFYSRHGAAVQIIPTVVDSDRYAGCVRVETNIPRIGWIGTPLNRHHLEMLSPVFHRLAADRTFELVVIGLNEPLDWSIKSIRYLDWALEGEMDFFRQFDIGIMPLKDSPFARGKCAFKLVQYMAAGLPVIASPVGANCDLVKDGLSGFLAHTESEWHQALLNLIDDPALRMRMGEQGQDTVRRSYSLQYAWPQYSPILKGTL